jgi:hypothetical protein
MLWSLGFAAITGVAAVLFSLGDLIGQLIATGLITAAACGLLILLSSAAERERGRTAALAGMAAVVVEYVLAMLLVWKVPRVLFGLRLEEELGLTMLNAAWFAVALMIVLRICITAAGRIGGAVGLATASLAFVSCLVAVWIERHPLRDEFFETGGALLTVGCLAMLGLIGLGRDTRGWWRLAGDAAAAAMLAIWLWGIWISRGGPAGKVAFAVCFTIAGLVAHASLCILCPLKPGQRWMLTGTLFSAVLTGVMVDAYVINDLLKYGWDRDLLARFASAAGILTSCGSLALCVLARLNRRMASAADAQELTELVAICPRCQRKQTLHAGRNACTACGLRIEVRIEEPCCAQCGYSLYGAGVAYCPECGLAIGQT